MKRITCTMLLLVFTLCIVGCTKKVPYNAILYDDAELYILDEFIDNNKISNAYYDNPNYDANDPESISSWIYNNEPKTRTIIISNQQEYDNVFKENQVDVNFENQIIYLYIFSDVYRTRNYNIDNIILENNVVNIRYKLSDNTIGVGNASMPIARYFVVVMDNVDVEKVEFVETR